MDDHELVPIAFELNGEMVHTEVAADQALFEVLRAVSETPSVRATCEVGVCGTCTVAVDGVAVSSCLAQAASVDGHRLLTSEGLTSHDAVSAVQKAFIDAGAYQCSYCIPAMALSVQIYLDSHPGAGPEELREQLSGNLCRCGTYPQILEAIRLAVAAEGTEVRPF